jgi:hypothetical protein
MTTKQWLTVIAVLVVGSFLTALESSIFPIQWQGWWHQHLHDDLRWTWGFITGGLVIYMLLEKKYKEVAKARDERMMKRISEMTVPSKLKIGEPSIN